MTTALRVLNMRYPALMILLLICTVVLSPSRALGNELGSDYEYQSESIDGTNRPITPPALPQRPDIQNIFSNNIPVMPNAMDSKVQAKPSLAWRQKAYQLFYGPNKLPKTNSEAIYAQSYSTVLKHLLNAFKHNNITIEEQELTAGQLLVHLPINVQNSSCIFALREFPKGTTTLRALFLDNSSSVSEKGSPLLQAIAQEIASSLEPDEAL